MKAEKVEKDQQNILQLVLPFVSQLFLFGFYTGIKKSGENLRIDVSLKEFLFQDEKTDGAILENLDLVILNLKEEGDITQNLLNASFILKRFTLIISEDFINQSIKTDKELKKHGIERLRVKFKKDILSVIGSYKKGLSFPFSVDFKFKVVDGKLVVDFNRFWAGDMVPMPRFIQSTLMGVMQNYMKSHGGLIKGIIFTNRFIKVDHYKIIPVDFFGDIHKVFMKEGFLVIEGGFDEEKAQKLLYERKKKIAEEEIKQAQEEVERLQEEEQQRENTPEEENNTNIPEESE